MTIIFTVDPNTQFVTTFGEGFCVTTSTDANKARGVDENKVFLVSAEGHSYPEFSAKWWKFEDYATLEAAMNAYPNMQNHTGIEYTPPEE